jgi:hypothetical protein
MYIENPEIPAQEAVEPLVFAKYLLGERYVSRRLNVAKFAMKRRYSLSILTLGKTWRIERMGTVSNER